MTAGNGHKRTLQFRQPPERVVSLVPSLTESLFELGLGNALVGVTDYCVHPAESVRQIPKVGGTKTPDIEKILSLKPDLVMANQEENTREAVEELEERGAPVWVTFPKTVRQALDVLWTITGLFQSQMASIRLQTLEMTLEWASSAEERRPVRYFCPIWFEQERPWLETPWWMTFNRETYCHDLLALLGGVNVFGARQRRYPLDADLGKMAAAEAAGRDTRYPRVTLQEIISAAPELVLLPNEPFPFGERELEQLQGLLGETPAGKSGRIHLVEGSLITWHGTRLARALRELPLLLD